MKQQFLESLLVLAELCDKQLSKATIALYDSALSPAGYDRACAALNKIALNRRSRDGFPSPREIMDLIAPPRDAQSEAAEAANRLLEAVAKFGWNLPDEARKFIGELGWLVVQRAGGWENVCAAEVKQVSFLRKQYTDMARGLYERSEQGKLGIAPGLPECVDSGPTGALAAGIGKAVPE